MKRSALPLVRGVPASELRATATAAVAADGNALIAGHGFDVEMEKIAGSGVFITYHQGRGMQVTPAVEMSALQDADDGGGAELGGVGDAIGGMQLAPQGDDFFGQRKGSAAWAEPRAGRTIPQSGIHIQLNPLDGAG